MKYLILFIVTSLICQPVTAQDYFQQTIDDTTLTNEQIFLNKIVPAPNGNFFVAGYEKWLVFAHWNYKGIVMMVDSSGNMLWNKIYNEGLSLKFQATVSVPDGCYVLGSSDSHSILMKLDLEGNLIESDVISNSESSIIYFDNMVAYQGGILLSGYEYSVNGKDVFLFKVDGAGNFTALGHHIFNTGFYVTGILADDSGFYLFGWMWNGGSAGSSLKNGIITRFSGEGNLLWKKKIKLDGGYGSTFIRTGTINEDRTVNVVYDASDVFGHNTKIGLCRIDSNGNFLLEKEFATSLIESLVIAGMSISKEKEITIFGGNTPNSYGDTMVVFRYDEDFNMIWSKSYDHISNLDPLSLPFSETGGGIAETEGGSLMISGYNSFAQKGVIRKITPDGLGCDAQDFFLENFNKPLSISDINNYSSEEDSFTLTPISLTVSSPLVSYFGCDTLVSAVTELIHSSPRLFPNPFNHTFTLTTNVNSEITIYDLAGRIWESHKSITGEFSGGEKLLPGIYFIRIETASGVEEILKVAKTE